MIQSAKSHRTQAFGTGHPSPAGIATALRRAVALWRARRRSRAALARLNDEMLKDIGIDRLARDREAQTPFWR